MLPKRILLNRPKRPARRDRLSRLARGESEANLRGINPHLNRRVFNKASLLAPGENLLELLFKLIPPDGPLAAPADFLIEDRVHVMERLLNSPHVVGIPPAVPLRCRRHPVGDHPAVPGRKRKTGHAQIRKLFELRAGENRHDLALDGGRGIRERKPILAPKSRIDRREGNPPATDHDPLGDDRKEPAFIDHAAIALREKALPSEEGTFNTELVGQVQVSSFLEPWVQAHDAVRDHGPLAAVSQEFKELAVEASRPSPRI